MARVQLVSVHAFHALSFPIKTSGVAVAAMRRAMKASPFAGQQLITVGALKTAAGVIITQRTTFQTPCARPI